MTEPVYTQQSEQQVQNEIVAACLESMQASNWDIGFHARTWKEKTGLSDAELGERIGLSKNQVQIRRQVSERFSDHTYGRLSWSHFAVSIAWDDADDLLAWAEKCEASVAEMKAYRRAQHGEDIRQEPVELNASDVPAEPEPTVAKPGPQKGPASPAQINAQSKQTRHELNELHPTEGRSGPSAGASKPERSDRRSNPEPTAEKGDTIAAETGKADEGSPDEVTPSELWKRVNDSLELLSECLETAKRKKLAKDLFDRACKLDPNLKPKVPTVSELIGEIPAGLSSDLLDAATDWAEYKQSLTGKDRIRSLKAWQTAVKQMRKYPVAVVCEAIETAIANGWTGWLQDSVKQSVARSGRPAPKSRFQQREANNDAAFDEVFGADVEESDVPF